MGERLFRQSADNDFTWWDEKGDGYPDLRDSLNRVTVFHS